MKLPDLSQLDGHLPEVLEKAYRLHYLAHDAKVAIFSIILLDFPLVAFGYNDFILFGFSPIFFVLISLRIVLLAYSIYLISYVLRCKSPDKFDLNLFIFLIAGMVAIFVINLSRPSTFMGNYSIDMVIILVAYIGLPTRLALRVFSNLLFTACELLIFLFFRQVVYSSEVFSTVFGLLFANVVGIYASHLIYSFRRNGYKARFEEELVKEKLRKNEQNLIALAKFPDENPNPVLRVDKQGTLLYANEASQLFLDEWDCCVGGKLPEIWQQFIQDVKGSGLPINVQLDCGMRIFSIDILPIKGEDYFNLYGRDITLRKLAEKELVLKANLLDSATDSIVLHDFKGNFLYMNEAMCESRGYTREELMKVNIVELTSDGNPELFETKMAELKEKGAVTFETFDKHKDGSLVAVEIHDRIIENGGQKLVLGVARNISERKKIEKELSLRAQLLDNTSDLILLHENAPDTYLVYVNKIACKSLGYDKDELLRMKIYQLIAPEFQKLVPARQRKLQKDGVAHFESALVCKDGTSMPVEVNSSIVSVDNKKFVLSMVRDYTERIKTRDALKKSEEMYRSLFDNMLNGFAYCKMIFDGKQPVDFTYLSVNSAFEHLTGLKNVTGKKVSEVIPGIRESDPDLFKKYGKVALTGVPDTFETQIKALDMWFSISVYSPEKEYFVAVFDVITERKKIEDYLRESEEKYKQLSENSLTGIFIIQDGKYVYVNEKFASIHGYEVEEMLGMEQLETVHPDERESMSKNHTLRFAGQMLTDLSLRRKIRKDGKLVSVEASTKVITYKGKPALMGNIVDVTERRTLEQKAQVANRLASIGEMAAGIAHEINNPLTGVIGYAGLLLEEDLPDPIKKDLITINDSAQRAAGVVRRLLTFARQSKPNRDYVNMHELIQNTLELRAYQLRTSNVEVVTQFASDIPATIADGAQLQQVFLNLITNAESAMQEAHGKGTLVITTCKKDNNILVSFKDDGRGITKENMEKLFTPFFTTKDVGKGTGLGLSICYGIITEHGGRIWAESKSGKGATFFVELPVVVNPEQLTMGEPEGEEAEETAKVKVLVVDDEEMIREFMERVLTEEGHEVDMAGNGEEALKKIEKGTYRLILLDMKMPGISGMEVFKHIKKIDKTLAKQVVFVTGDVMGADTEAFLKQSRAPYVTKPFDADQFKQKIRHLLNKVI